MSLSRNRISNTLDLARYGRAAALVAVAVGASASACGTSASEGTSHGGKALAAESYVPIVRGAHPFARPELDRGPLEPDKLISNLSVVFKLTPAQIADRDALIEAQLKPGSPSYHRWLTPEAYAARFGAPPDAVARTTAWLAQQGLQVHETSPLGARVTFSGRVSDLQAAFHAPMRKYEVGGKMHYAMATAPSVPASLADVVLAVHHTNDFYPHPMVRVGVNVSATAGTLQPRYTNGFQVGLDPSDWANVYDVTKLYTQGVPGTPVVDGTGVTVGIVGVAAVGQGDIDQFRTKFGLPPTTLVTTLVPNTGPAEGNNGAGIEAYLDTEWSGGIAKGATVNFILSGSDDPDPDAGVYYAIEHNLVGIISESFGSCELGVSPSYSDIVSVYGSAAELLGITYLASSGDSGADGCADYPVAGLYVDIPAAYPGITAVGGTSFATGAITYDSTGLAEGYGPEQVWNDINDPVPSQASPTGAESGGGGISNAWARPSYQTGLSQCAIVGTLPTPVSPANQRQVPDVSFNAGLKETPDLIMCELSSMYDCLASGTNDSVVPVGGTSAAAPAFAGVVALLTQATGGQRLGNINPLLYALATSTPLAFHDITNGNNEILCDPASDPGCPTAGLFGYVAAKGYDCASGLGSVDAFNLVSAWAALAPTTIALAAMPTSTTPGGTVNLDATVTVTTPNMSAVDGTVRFDFESYNQDGSLDLSWTFGTATITGGSATGGSVTLSGPIPIGQINPSAEYIDVVAMYGGDPTHLASFSPKVRIPFTTTSTFCLVPSTGSMQPCQGFTFTSTGGTAPVKWYVAADSTCDMNGNCSTLDENTGAFVAGPTNGYVVVQALDANSIEQYAFLTVGDVADAGPPIWGDAQAPAAACTAMLPDAGLVLSVTGACAPPEAGSPVDAGMSEADGSVASMEGGQPVQDGGSDDAAASDASGDAAAAGGGGSKSGCSCDVVTHSGGAPAGAYAGLGLGLAVLIRRRRRGCAAVRA